MSLATQWELVENVADCVWPIYQKLIELSAKGEVVHNDDTTARVLSLIQENAKDPDRKRKGIFTSAIAQRHRKNSLFYKTEHGAIVGDIVMSLIYTCVLSDENPLNYLIALQNHKSNVHHNPYAWLPWNYQKTLKNLTDSQAFSSSSDLAPVSRQIGALRVAVP